MIDDFPLGMDHIPSDVGNQEPKITRPQFLHLMPKVRRQWSKMVSIRRRSPRALNLVRVDPSNDVVPLMEAHIKGQRISKVYVDGGAQMCVMSEKLMNRLGMEASGPSMYKARQTMPRLHV